MGEPLAPLRNDGGDDVYPPSEDTHLLQEALSLDANYIVETCGEHPHFLEIGTGSGAVARHIADTLPACVTAIDVNWAALRRARHEAPAADLLRGDLLCWAAPNVRFDVVVFNPPYVPTDDGEMQRALRERDIAASWAGGDRGREVIDRALPAVLKVLERSGLFYLVLEKINDIEDVRDLAKKHGFSRGDVVCSTAAGTEQLFVVRFAISRNHDVGDP